MSNGHWTAWRVPLPADASPSPQVDFSAISCPSTTSCVGIGNYVNKFGYRVGLIETLAANKWTPSTVAFPVSGATTNPDLSLDSVSCGAAGSCVVVGQFESSAPHYAQVGLLLQLSGGAWTEQIIGDPATQQIGRLHSVSCTSADWCVAVGEVPYSGVALIDTFESGQWTMKQLPVSGLIDLNSVACPAQGSCTAVGGGGSAGQSGPTQVETLSNGVWTASSVVPPPGGNEPGFEFEKVACAAGNICASYASYYATLNVDRLMLAVIGNGYSFAVPAPVPADGRGGGSTADPYLTDISCPSPGNCTAVGDYIGPGGYTGLIETLANGRWTATPFRYPAGEVWVTDVHASDVSCTAPSVCQVVGTQDFIKDNQAQYSPLAEQLR
jgi:hypothetical protein